MDKAQICRQCNKEVKTEVHYCVPCDKYFYPSCMKLHRVYDEANELVPCGGKIEKKCTVKRDGKMSGESSRERKVSAPDDEQKLRERGASTSVSMKDTRIENIYRMVQGIKDEMIGKKVLKRIITEAIDEEKNRMREELQHWKTCELEALIREAVKTEMQKVLSNIPMPSMGTGHIDKSYSGAVKKNQESVLIIKPKDGKENNSSENTKKDIKKIDISKLGVGITKMRKVTNGTIVVGCENKSQAEKLKQEVVKDLGRKYEVQAPRRRKLKMKIFDVDKEDCENEQHFWEKIVDQNGLEKNTIEGKIVYSRMARANSRITAVIVEVNAETREKFQQLEKLKIGWNICKVQDYVGILRCFKCCGYYHFAKDCKKKETCGNCAEQHATKECKGEAKKCINCEEKSKVFKIKNLKSDHSAYDSNCPCFRKEIEKQRDRIQCNNI